MKNKFRIIYFNVNSDKKQQLWNKNDFETLEEAEKDIQSFGLGIGVPNSKRGHFNRSSDSEVLVINRVEIWLINEHGDEVELIKTYKK